MNYLAIVVAAVAGYGFGAVYYMSLSKAWLDAVGKTRAELGTSKAPFIVAAVANLIMAAMLGGIMIHIGQVSIRGGVISAGFCWLGFVVTTTATNYAFGGRKMKLTVIDGIHWLGVLVIQGAVIGAFGV